MNEGKRPGGLTALAVINFVFSGWGVIGMLMMAAFFAFVGMIPTDEMEEAQRAQIEAFQNMGLPLFIFVFALTILSSVLLLLSGIGYLNRRSFWGGWSAIRMLLSVLLAALSPGCCSHASLGEVSISGP